MKAAGCARAKGGRGGSRQEVPCPWCETVYLDERGIGTLILVGIQTEYCIDTTCRVAFENGFVVVIPEMTNTTFDNGELTGAQIYDYHNRRIFDGRFATLRSMTETLEAIENGGRFS